jgi:hypothetical protein
MGWPNPGAAPFAEAIVEVRRSSDSIPRCSYSEAVDQRSPKDTVGL